MLKIKNKHDFLKFLLGLSLLTLLIGCSKPEKNTESTLSSKSSSNVAMCGSDKDCKGDRICVKGECKSPTNNVVDSSKNDSTDNQSNICPKDFKAFVTKYRNDLAFQKKYTAQTVKIIEAEPDNTKQRIVKHQNLEFPVISTELELKKSKFKYHYKHENNLDIVTDYLDETGLADIYRFKKNSNCWILVEHQSLNF